MFTGADSYDSPNNGNAKFRPMYDVYFESSSHTSMGTKCSEADHHAKLGEYAEYLWKRKDLTDVMIVVEDMEFKAHKTVLACYSPYFKEVLLKPGANNVHYLEIPCVTAKAFDILLYYMYTGEMKLTCQDIANVYRAARKLGMKDALNNCLELLSVSVEHIENAINLYVTSKKLHLTEPAEKAFLLMTKHFEAMTLSQEFLDMTEDQVVEYFSADELVVRSEIMVFLAALKWINYKFLEREIGISRVMGTVRFSNMVLEEIVHCYHPPLLPAIVLYPTVELALYRGTAYISSKQFNHEGLFEEFAQPPRFSRLDGEPLILWDCLSLYSPKGFTGRKFGDAAVKIQAAFRGSIVRKKYKPILQDRKKMRLEEEKQKKNAGFFAKVEINTKSPYPMEPPTSIPSLPTVALESSREVTKLTDVLYIVGGIEAEKDNSGILCCGSCRSENTDKEKDDLMGNVICSYYPNSEEMDFKELTTLQDQRHNLKTVCHNNILYCVGGCVPLDFDGRKMVPKADCYSYNLRTKTWFPMSPMITPRAFHGLIVLSGRIYAFGGKNEQEIIQSSCERFDPRTNSWELIEDLPNPIMAMGACGYRGMIWIAGGLTGANTKKMTVVSDTQVFEFDPFNYTTVTNLPTPLCFTELVSANDKIYCIGGSTQYNTNNASMKSVSTVYQYNLENDSWTVFVDMPVPIHTPVALGFDNYVFVVGGYSSVEKCMIKEVLCLDCEEGNWFSSPLPVPTINYAIGVAAGTDRGV